MSGYNNEYDPDGFEAGNDSTGGGLRKQLEEALAMNKRLVEKLEGNDRQKTVADLLQAKGLDPAVSELIPTDADPAKWLDEKGHLLGAKRAEEPNDGQSEPAPEASAPKTPDPAVAAEMAGRAAMDAAQASGQPASVQNDLLNQLDGFSGTTEELEKFFEMNGADPSLS